MIVYRDKHGQVHNSTTVHMFKCKWFKTIYHVWVMWRKKSWTFEKHIDLQSQAIFVNNLYVKKSLRILEDNASCVQVDVLNTQLSNFLYKT